MSDLRSLCRCGHVRSSHVDGAGSCSKNAGCPCEGWVPAYPVFDAALPLGVVAIRDLASGLSLVECRHEMPRSRSWCPWCFAEAWFTDGFRLPVRRLVFAPTELRLL